MFGFWIFLMSDAVIFALLFAVYGTTLARPSAARPGQRVQDWPDLRRDGNPANEQYHLRYGLDRDEAWRGIAGCSAGWL